MRTSAPALVFAVVAATLASSAHAQLFNDEERRKLSGQPPAPGPQVAQPPSNAPVAPPPAADAAKKKPAPAPAAAPAPEPA